MIKSTKEYEIFKIKECNRDIKENHVTVLVNSISTKNLLRLNPILVDENMYVIDGQHRLEACKKLEIDVWYKVEKNLKNEDILLLQNQKKWFLEDYIKYYSKNGVESYIKLNDFISKNSLSLNKFLKCSQYRGGHQCRGIKDGKYEFCSKDCQDFLEIHFKIKYIEGFINERRNNIKNVTSSISFYCALYSFLKRSDVFFDELIGKIEQKIEVIGIRSREGGYYSMLLEIYNFRRRDPIDYYEQNT